MELSLESILVNAEKELCEKENPSIEDLAAVITLQLLLN